MNRRKILSRILGGFHQNVSYSDLVGLITGLGFREVRIRGSHHQFRHQLIPEVLNLQSERGQAKAYQIRQIVRLIRRYNLKLEEDG